MKKLSGILLIWILIVCTASIVGQFKRFVVEAENNLITNGWFTINGDSINNTTKTGSTDTTLITKGYLQDSTVQITEADTTRWGQIVGTEYDPIFASDSGNIVHFGEQSFYDHYDVNQDMTSDNYDVLFYYNGIWDSWAIWHLERDTIFKQSVSYSITAADTTRWGSLTETDSTVKFVTPTQLYNYLDIVGINKNVYSITLPYSTTVAGRVALATEGTDYQTGWTLTGDGLDLVVTHNVGRNLANITVWANTTGTVWQQLFNTAAYNGISALSNNELKIYSIATVAKPIRIEIIFE